MLPLDKLTDSARQGFLERGCDPGAFDAVLSLDMTLNGDFGQSWLALDRLRKRLYRLCETDGTYDEFSLGAAGESVCRQFHVFKQIARS